MAGPDARLLGPELRLEPANAGGSQRIAALRRAAAESVFIWPMLLLVGVLMLFRFVALVTGKEETQQ